MAKFYLVVELSCLKKRVLKPKCAVTNVDWNILTFEFLAKDEQNLLGRTSNYLRSSDNKKFQNISRPVLKFVSNLPPPPNKSPSPNVKNVI